VCGEHPPTSLYLYTREPQERVIWLTISAGLESDFENNHKFIGILRATCLTDLAAVLAGGKAPYVLRLENSREPLERERKTLGNAIAISETCISMML